MQIQLNNAFAKVNYTVSMRQLSWFTLASQAVRAYYHGEVRRATLEVLRHTARGEAQAVHAADKRRLETLAGGKTWLAAIWATQTDESRAAFIEKNVAGLIARRDAQIIKALTKVGITAIPEFDLVEFSDGFEGSFNVAGRVVTIRTILAGGYNIQCLHTRTLVKVK